MHYVHAIALTLAALVLQACDGRDSRRVGEVTFPVFAECQPEIEHLRGRLQAGDSGGEVTIERFPIPIESHLSLLGVARARLPDHPLLGVTPQEYLQVAVSGLFQSCMPNIGVRLNVDGFGEQLQRSMPGGLYRSDTKFYAEIEGDSIGIFFNDGTYNYIKQNDWK